MNAVESLSTEPHMVERVLAQLDSLPALSPIVARILQLTGDSKSGAREVIKLIESDPALTTRMLSLLGRADHGVRAEAITLSNAVVLLGFNAVRHVVLTTKVMEVFGPPAASARDGGFNRAEFWKYCLAVACAARKIALHLRSTLDPEEAFVCGLLHNIGMAALDAGMPKTFARIVRTSEETRTNILDVERSLLGVDHTVVGHRLAERWGLPDRLVDCIWLHEQDPDALPQSVAEGRHVQTVQLAAAIARQRRVGFSGCLRAGDTAPALAARLGLTADAVEAIADSLIDEIEQRAQWIGLDALNSRELYTQVLKRTTDELAVANAELIVQNRRLERKASWLRALSGLNRAISPRDYVREVCAAAAEALRQAMGIDAVIVFASTADDRWLEIGRSGSPIQTEIVEQTVPVEAYRKDTAFAARLATTGTWIAPPAPSWTALVERHRARLGTETVWLMPLLCEAAWAGGALFCADTERVADWHDDNAEIMAMSAACGLAIAHAQTRAAALALREELTEANRRCADAQAASWRAKTLERVVAMAAGAAHEMNTPLAVVSGWAQVLRRRAESDEDRKALDTIVSQTDVCSNILTDLTEFARPRPPKPEPIDLMKMLASLRSRLAEEEILDANCLAVDIPSHTPAVRFDREQLMRTFRELLQNAADATEPETRRLAVKARADLAEMTVAIVVEDNGTGMTPETRERAFDPFFSHRPAGRRRGLGLARVRQWVGQNGGTVRIDSEPGDGTRVEMKLTAVEN
ncbi:MAG: HDOD domain-containing protein [Phycisphaerae bacterium]